MPRPAFSGTRQNLDSSLRSEIKKKGETPGTEQPSLPEKESVPPVSLKGALESKTVSFSGKPRKDLEWIEKKKKRKSVNLEELKKTLEESLEKLKKKT